MGADFFNSWTGLEYHFFFDISAWIKWLFFVINLNQQSSVFGLYNPFIFTDVHLHSLSSLNLPFGISWPKKRHISIRQMSWTIHFFAIYPLFKGWEAFPQSLIPAINCTLLTFCGPWFLAALNLWLSSTYWDIVILSPWTASLEDLFNVLSSFTNLCSSFILTRGIVP